MTFVFPNSAYAEPDAAVTAPVLITVHIHFPLSTIPFQVKEYNKPRSTLSYYQLITWYISPRIE